MNVLIVLVVLLFLSGIILLGGKSPFKKRTREQFLPALAEFLEGALEPIEDEAYHNSFRIRFKYEGKEFIFEDLEEQGFKDKVYIAYLKVQTPSKLTLTFTEKRRSSKIRADIFMASEISTQQIGRPTQLHVPDHLKDLNVFTNDPVSANKLFEDRKINSILKQFKNINSQGYPFLAVGIFEGTVSLGFYSGKTLSPNLHALWADVASIEDYLNKIITIVRKLEKNS